MNLIFTNRDMKIQMEVAKQRFDIQISVYGIAQLVSRFRNQILLQVGQELI